MDISKILNDLGLDFSDPEIKLGAMEAIDAILSSREPPLDLPGGMGGGGGETDVEIDPDLIQPSVKHSGNGSDDDIEIDDEEDILSQVKTNDSEDDINDESNGNSSSSSGSGSAGSDSDNIDDEDSEVDDFDTSADDKESGSTRDKDTKSEDGDDSIDSVDSGENEDTADTDSADDESDDGDYGDFDDDGADSTNDVDDELSDEDDEEENDTGYSEVEDTNDFEDEDSDSDNESEEDEEFDEEDLLDDTYDDGLEDEAIKTKNDVRKIKRERTVAAGKKALEDAKARNAAPALIRELEKAIAALEELTEAVKNIKDISDEEFNQMVNRVLDAIDAVGDKSLTYSSDEERQIRAKEIKADLASNDTQIELSAEDAAKIRADHQQVKAREKEAAKYQTKGRGSFKGFQDFLNSLYKAVALQVNTEEIRDDSWSAINRRYNNMGVLKQGKKIQELPNKKIPVIDFYFDQSGSWNDSDIKVGEKAVQCLADMEAEGKIKINIYYFSNDVYTDAASARADGGTAGWNEIVKNVISTQATNVIIMTDADMENWWHGDTALSYTVPGYVWYLWRDGINAPRLPRDLKGRGGTQQFSFHTATDA